MICSLGELGISDSVVPKEFADGIQILPQDAVPGDEVFSYLDLMMKSSNFLSHQTVQTLYLCVGSVRSSSYL